MKEKVSFHNLLIEQNNINLKIILMTISNLQYCTHYGRRRNECSQITHATHFILFRNSLIILTVKITHISDDHSLSSWYAIYLYTRKSNINEVNIRGVISLSVHSDKNKNNHVVTLHYLLYFVLDVSSK